MSVKEDVFQTIIKFPRGNIEINHFSKDIQSYMKM